MAYAGLPPASFTNNLTNVQLIDDISSSFNGSTQTFALTTNSSPFHAVSARSLLVTLGGVTQKPQVDYTVDGTNITFTTAPVNGLTFAARNIYGLNYLNNVNDGVITPAKLSTGAPTWNTGGTVTVSGDLNVTGSFNSGAQGLFWGDNETANFGDASDLKIYHDASDSYIVNEFGNLYIDNYANDNDIKLRTDNGTGQATDYIICDGSAGSVLLHHYGTKKFETTSYGAAFANDSLISILDSSKSLSIQGGGTTYPGGKITLRGGSNANPGISFYTGGQVASPDERLHIDSAGNIGIGTDNPTEKLEVSGNLKISSDGVGASATSHDLLFYGTSSGSAQINQALMRSSPWPTNTNAGQLEFYTSNGSNVITQRVVIDGAGSVLPATDATQDFGATNKRWANVYSADLQLSNEGSTNDVDGTWGQYTIQEGEEDLFLINRRNGKKYKFVLQEVN